MIWQKTEAGREELKRQALIRKAATRNLLLVIDGSKSEDLLLKYTIGVSQQDFRELHRLGLIRPVGEVSQVDVTLPDLASRSTASSGASAARSESSFAAELSSVVSTILGSQE